MAKSIGFVVRISSSDGAACKECSRFFDGSTEFAKAVNHYLRRHTYQLLHVGSEAGTDYDSKSCQHTVAIVGTKRRPKKNRKALRVKKPPAFAGH